jgi:hypothetical protein
LLNTDIGAVRKIEEDTGLQGLYLKWNMNLY